MYTQCVIFPLSWQQWVITSKYNGRSKLTHSIRCVIIWMKKRSQNVFYPLYRCPIIALCSTVFYPLYRCPIIALCSTVFYPLYRCPIIALCSTALMAPVVAGAVVGTILPILAATILAYCITGYIRDSLFGGTVKKCIGPSCNILVSTTLNTLVNVCSSLY